MKGKRIDDETKAKVVLAKIANPLNVSHRDIEEQTWVPKSTVWDILNDSQEVLQSLDSSGKAKELYDYNLEIINDWARKVASAMKTMSPEDIREAKEMQAIVETAFKQNQLIKWKPTEIVKEVSESQALTIAERFLWRKKN